MRGIKRYQGRTVLVSTQDGGAMRGTLWRVERDGIELRNATEAIRGVDLSGIVWVPASQINQLQVQGGDS